jgi:hypothetical protein
MVISFNLGVPLGKEGYKTQNSLVRLKKISTSIMNFVK